MLRQSSFLFQQIFHIFFQFLHLLFQFFFFLLQILNLDLCFDQIVFQIIHFLIFQLGILFKNFCLMLCLEIIICNVQLSSVFFVSTGCRLYPAVRKAGQVYGSYKKPHFADILHFHIHLM